MYTYQDRGMASNLLFIAIWTMKSLGIPLQLTPKNIHHKVRTKKRIHICKKDSNFQVSKCSPWGSKVWPYKDFKNKMTKYLSWRKKLGKSYVGRHMCPKVDTERRNLNTLTPSEEYWEGPSESIFPSHAFSIDQFPKLKKWVQKGVPM